MFISEEIESGNKRRSAEDIAQEDGNHIIEKLTPADICTRPNTGRNDEHIGNKVLETD